MKKFLAFLLVLTMLVVLVGCSGNNQEISSDISSNPSSQMPIPDPITVTVGATGDYLIHTPIITSHLKSDGSYDFTDMFKYVTEYYNEFDYFVGNLEVTFGKDSTGYKGTGSIFNCPDSLSDALKGAGVDMLLTANNHAYDTYSFGFNRTMQVLEQRNLAYIGTHKDNEKNYKVVDLGGIKIGMINYTYQTSTAPAYSLNGITLKPEDTDNINTFADSQLDAFYAEMATNLDNMYSDGAEAIMLYIHWGNEYHEKPVETQKIIAQKMCDMGVDVIVGGHPHVVEPIDVLTSDVSGKQTVCIYSTGNAVSNQRIAAMPNTSKKFPNVAKGATEDGVIFSVSFTKQGTGEVTISAIDAMPTWVNMYYEGGRGRYQIIPLDTTKDFNTSFNLTAVANGPTLAKNSYNRTMAIVGGGLEKFPTVYKTTDTRRK
ncbi:MAG: CapA family protein [Clostridia bacterium]|nr:CapA family protein [Clostridia bacterium]